MGKKIDAFKTFFRYNIVAGIATAIDFTLLVFLTEALGFWYLLSTVIGALGGGITAFILERNWTFKSKDGKLSVQALRYFFIWISSILLNVAGMYLFVDYIGIQYIYSKIIVATMVGVGFNFVTHKYYIFR